jgi:hypothetical protein
VRATADAELLGPPLDGKLSSDKFAIPPGTHDRRTTRKFGRDHTKIPIARALQREAKQVMRSRQDTVAVKSTIVERANASLSSSRTRRCKPDALSFIFDRL